jgi:5-methylcytosine-specific restriction endonuclease McrA
MVPHAIRQLVRQRAQLLCEYCHSPEVISPDRFTLDHIQPQSKRSPLQSRRFHPEGTPNLG